MKGYNVPENSDKLDFAFPLLSGGPRGDKENWEKGGLINYYDMYRVNDR